MQRYADLRPLMRLPPAVLAVTACAPSAGTLRVTLANPSRRLAFFVRMWLTKGARGPDLAPVLVDDDDVSLAPLERRAYTIRYPAGPAPTLHLRGVNVAAQTLAPAGIVQACA